MSEMLANQYFLVRRYEDAELAFENVLAEEPSNKYAKKKLIICYVHNGKIRKALETFYQMINDDIEFITHTDVVADDCPCPELIEAFEKKSDRAEYTSVNILEVYGILWLYCDMEKSLYYFKKLNELNPSESIYSNILRIYNSYNSEIV